MNSCKVPKCHLLEKRNKCIKPNPYIEYIAWCKRNNIKHSICKDDYKKLIIDINDSCNKYKERIENKNKPKIKKSKVVKPNPKLRRSCKT